MNIRTVLRALSVLYLLLGIIMLFCGGYAYWHGEYSSVKGMLLGASVAVIPSVYVLYFIRQSGAESMSIRESYLLVSFAWIGTTLLGTIPFYVSGEIPNLADAFFEASSGFSTTGATILKDIEALPQTMLLWRSLSHWLGGMGIIVLTVALLPLLGIGGVQLVRAEATGMEVSKVAPRIQQTAKALWFIYLGFTVLGIGLYLYGGMSVFDAVNHTFSVVSTGGFSTKNASLGYFRTPFVQWVTVALMIGGGISFTLYYSLFTGRVFKFFKNTEFRAYIGIIFFVGLFIALINHYYGIYTNWEENFRAAYFQTASVITTTGFATENYINWPNLSQILLFLLFFIGGCGGSTSGGFKVSRVVIMMKQAINEMRRILHPRGVFPLRMNGISVNKEVVYAVSGFFFLYMLTVLMMTLIACLAGADILTAFSAGLATVGNIGPGLGSVGPVDNWGFFPDYAKFAFGIGMLAGRLEITTFFILLMPFFWRR